MFDAPGMEYVGSSRVVRSASFSSTFPSFQVTFGHRAPTKSMPLDTTSIEGDMGDKRRCPRCSGKVFEAEKMVTGLQRQ